MINGKIFKSIETQIQTKINMSLNTIKALVITYHENKMIPETFSFDYFALNEIKSRFTVMTRGCRDLLEFSNLKSALKYIEILADKITFNTREFYDNFRIVEFKYENGKYEILSVIVNLVDFFDILIKIKDGKINKEQFLKDDDFNRYYTEYASFIS